MTNLEKFIEEKVKEFENASWFSFPPQVRSAHGYAKGATPSGDGQIYEGRAENLKEFISDSLHALLAEIEKGVKELKGLPDFEDYAVARKDVLALLHPSEPKED